MKLWLVLRSYGVANLRTFLTSHVKMAKHFQGIIGMDTIFEIVVPRTFAMVCFRLKPSAVFKQKIAASETQTNEMNAKLLESVNASGRIYMTHAVVGGAYMIRFLCWGNTLSEEHHVIGAWKVVQEHTDTILGELDGTIVHKIVG
ncbi:hypothetical protein MKW92_014600 [Papaver armeniacum]|nr:hypothetical protein MKW92_014600 [Papaver armeniacum]